MAKNVRVLVVDDADTDATVIRDQLIAQEYDVETLGDSREAYDQILAPDNGNYDLLVFDVNLPGLDGVTLAKRLRQQEIHTPVLFISGGIDPAIKLSITSMGPSTAFLEKGWDQELFLATCTELLARNHLVSQMSKMDGKLDELTLLFTEKMPTTEDFSYAVDQKLEEHCPLAHEPILRLVKENSQVLSEVDQGKEAAKLSQEKVCSEHKKMVNDKIEESTSIDVIFTNIREHSVAKMVTALLGVILTFYVTFSVYTYKLADGASREVIKIDSNVQVLSNRLETTMERHEEQVTRIERSVAQLVDQRGEGSVRSPVPTPRTPIDTSNLRRRVTMRGEP